MAIWKRHKPSLSGPLPEYWVSISDLMSGLLLVFILLLVVAMYHYAAFTQVKEEQVEKKDQVLKEQELRVLAFEEQKIRLIKALKASLGSEQVQVDEMTGVVRIGEGVLFDEDKADITPEGHRRLIQIFNRYLQVVLSAPFRDSVERIIIEGHTNSHGTYFHNLQLSQQRANAVMRTWLSMPGVDLDLLQKKIVASGRSWSDLIRDDNGNEDRVRSRRIEIAFRLKESELMRSVFEKVRHSQPQKKQIQEIP